MADEAKAATATPIEPIPGDAVLVQGHGHRDREYCLEFAIRAKPAGHHREPEQLVADARVFEAYLNEPLPEAAPAES